MSRVFLAAIVVSLTAGVSFARQTTTGTQTKAFEVLSVEGNTLVVKLPEGTREMVVADDFRFTINGQPMSVHQLKPGMKGTATITTTTTVTPVTVTEVKNGTVVQATGSSIIVRTDEGFKSFTQGDVDKRGVKIMRGGRPAAVSAGALMFIGIPLLALCAIVCIGLDIRDARRQRRADRAMWQRLREGA